MYLLKFRIFLDVAPCSHVDVDRRFRGASTSIILLYEILCAHDGEGVDCDHLISYIVLCSIYII
jgi:hypothetical protein